MALTPQQQLELTALIVGMYDAAPGYAIMSSIADAKIGGASNTAIANSLAAGAEFRSIYPSFLTNTQFVAKLVDTLGAGSLTPASTTLANSLLMGVMNGGATRGATVETAVRALLTMSESDPNFGVAAAIFNNKVEVAQYFTVDLQRSGDSLGELQAVLAGVDETQASVVAAKAAAAGLGTGGDSLFLTGDQDVLNGSSFADSFVADVVQVAGLQVNSLGTGDRLNGGAGNDLLEAQVVIAATHGESTNMAIQPRTTSVEDVRLEALNIGLGGANSNVFVSAKDMTSLESIGSSWSDANLIIQDLTTRTDAGAKRLTSDVTIVMEYTGNWDSSWDESDLHVYFDQNYLLADVEAVTTPSQANYWLLDQDSDDYVNEPLREIDRDGFLFSLNGVAYEVTDLDLLDSMTWENYAAGIQDLIDAMVAGGTTALAGIEVIVDYGNIEQTFNDDGEIVTIPAISLIDTNGGEFSALGFSTPVGIIGSFNVFGRNNTEDPTVTTSEFITATIELEKAGRGGDGGDLVVGGMNKTSDNTWNGIQGIEQFNVTVFGGDDLPNSIASMHSTNNQLQIVNIESDDDGADTFAPLEIGNSQSTGYALKDVQILNGADFMGDLSVVAGITPESLMKYPDLEDGGTPAVSDNILFYYDLSGPGDNTLDLEVSQEVVAHEDMWLALEGGNGDDSFTLEMLSMSGSLLVNWYADQAALANVSVMSGAGNDFIHLPGSGDVIVNAGPGDDLLYTDNSAGQAIVNGPGSLFTGPANAHWVTNAVNTNIHDLLGAGAGANYFLYGATLTVTISGPGFTGVAGGIISPAADSFSNGFESTVTILPAGTYVGNHTSINQALKAAINGHATLSGVLRAYDGPNNSVIIESLVDGQFVASDLLIEVAGPSTASITALSAGQMSLMNQAYGDFINNSAATLGTPAAAAATIAGQVGTLSGLYQGINTSSLATDGEFTPGSAAVQEVQVIDFGGFGVPAGGGGDIDVGGITVALLAGDTDADIANAVALAINGMILANSTLPVVAVVNGAEVEITYDALEGDVTEVVLTTPVVAPATIESNLVPVGEEQLVDFGGVTAPNTGNITVGGVIVNVTSAMTSAQIATAVVAAINASGTMTDPPATGVTAEVDLVLDPLGETVRVFFEPADGDVAAIVFGAGSSGILVGPAVTDNDVLFDPIGSGDPAVVEDVPVTTDAQGALAVAPAGFGVVIEGVDSTATTDNTIDMGPGQDVVVLSTSLAANETLVWTGLGNGESSIFNFSVAGASQDMVDFSAYLTSMTSASGSAASAVDIATTVQMASGVVNANEVVIVPFASLVAAVGVTWTNLTTTSLAAALNANTAVWQVGGTGTTLFGTNKAVIMIENPADNGDYKIFELAMTNPVAPTNTGFTVVGLIGVADFGETLTGATAANFV